MKRLFQVLYWFVAAIVAAIFSGIMVVDGLKRYHAGKLSFDEGVLTLFPLLLPAMLLALALGELGRYLRWKAGYVDQQDVELALALAAPKAKRIEPSTREKCRIIYYHLKETAGRAKRRWPRRKKELAGHLKRRWSRKEWTGVAIFGLGELGFLLVGHAVARTTFVPLGGVILTNLLVLMFWVAGDDDEGGQRDPQPKPLPIAGQVRLRTALPVERAQRSGAVSAKPAA